MNTHIGIRGRLCLSKPEREKPLPISHGSEVLTWLCCVHNAHSLRTWSALYTFAQDFLILPQERMSFVCRNFYLCGEKACLFFNRVFLMKVFYFDRTCLMIIKSRCADLGTFLQQCIYLKYIFHINSLMRTQQSPRWNHRVPPNDPRSPRLQKRQMVKQYR